MGQGPVKSTHIFNSWKEIASYLGRGVRTLQRWELELRLPVHRLGSTDRGHVFAFKAELDTWLRTQAGSPKRPADAPPPATKSDRIRASLSTLDRSALLTSKTMQLIETQQAYARSIAEQVRRIRACWQGSTPTE